MSGGRNVQYYYVILVGRKFGETGVFVVQRDGDGIKDKNAAAGSSNRAIFCARTDRPLYASFRHSYRAKQDEYKLKKFSTPPITFKCVLLLLGQARRFWLTWNKKKCHFPLISYHTLHQNKMCKSSNDFPSVFFFLAFHLRSDGCNTEK